MKKIILFLMTTGLLACKKDLDVCKNPKETGGRQQLIDISSIPAQELRDTLAKYPQLQAYNVVDMDLMTSITCHTYYNNLLVFTGDYSLTKFKITGLVDAQGKILTGTLPVSLAPSVSYKDAIKEAKNNIDLDHLCITYQLGLYNLNAGAGLNAPANYRLAWRIQPEKQSYPFVIIDAQNKLVIARSYPVFQD